jgi:hypothetical protein
MGVGAGWRLGLLLVVLGIFIALVLIVFDLAPR